ncbi:MAG: hypothetical protein ACRC1P_03455 [Cellulosilyticaceae bacterium]
MNKVKKEFMYSLVVIGVLLLSMCGYMYKTSATYTLDQYIQSINEKNYSKTYELLYQSKEMQDFGQDTILKYIQHYFESNQLIEMSKIKVMEQKETFQSYKITYQFANNLIESSIGLIKEDENWKVMFPFKIEKLKVYAPLGAEVMVNNKKLIMKDEKEYLEMSVLPGKYTIKISYPEGVQTDYITSIQVPKQREVHSPYPVQSVEVAAPINTSVELAGCSKLVEEESVQFDNIVEGTYSLKIFDQYNNLEEYNEQVNITSETNHFKIDAVKVSSEGYTKMSQFINEFYKDYKKGILNKDSTFFKEYGEITDLKESIKAYEEWLINNKMIKDAKIDVNIEKFNLNDSNHIDLKVLEVIELINEEEKETVEYQVVLKWENQIEIVNGEYKIKERKLVESLVSYKDNNGNWIQY